MNENQQQNNEQQEQQQEQVETVAKSKYDTLVAELEKVKTKLPKELTEEEKALQEKQKELFDKEIQLTLKENGLEQFKDIVKVANDDELKETIKKLNKIVNNIKIEVGYIPEDHKQVTAYEQAKQKGDTKGMIKSLFGFN
ncbi:hypothetical protein NST61_17010 [Caldifermentibacillus hisashii]|uniref:hypothetical protein n=1 Tax=Caldifermentibacillus hisashii TaxID=996558 RepID=UPI0034D5D030